MNTAFFFWFSFLGIIYTFLGYPLLIFIVSRFVKKQPELSQKVLPTVSLIVPCYNESAIIPDKISNTLNLIYPDNLIEVIFVIDGSNDGSEKLFINHPNIRLLYEPIRKGKSAAITRASKLAIGEILIFTDANTILNKDCILELVRAFNEPKVGAVSGEKKINILSTDGSVSTEGAYWKYESLIKKSDAKVGTVVGAAGELMAVKKELFIPIPKGIINDDQFITLTLIIQGYKVNYTDKAFASERPSDTMKDELKRKIRMVAGSWQILLLIKPLHKLIGKNPLYAFQFFSHKWCRWIFAPIAIIFCFILLIILIDKESGVNIYSFLLFGYLIFIALACLGYLFRNAKYSNPIFHFPYYFFFVNYCSLMGFISFLKGNTSVTWEKANRKLA